MSQDYSSSLSANDLAAVFSEHGSWITGFKINGVKYGGDYIPQFDFRVLDFVDRLKRAGVKPRRILECGCLEGGHTLVLAQAFPEARIRAVDVRAQSLAKAAAVARVVGVTNVEFAEVDLENADAALGEGYDAIFCVGLLYHLADPLRFLRRTAAAAPVLWLWTVYCAEEEAIRTSDARRGRMHPEAVEHPLSSVRTESYLPTLGMLADYLWECGYTDVDLLKKEMTANGNGPAILLCATRAESK